jgi:hypothetical protein
LIILTVIQTITQSVIYNRCILDATKGNINSLNYYLYIDDSGKLHDRNCTHVIYSYVLLDKEKRDALNKNYVNAFKKIRQLGKDILNTKYSKKDLKF